MKLIKIYLKKFQKKISYFILGELNGVENLLGITFKFKWVKKHKITGIWNQNMGLKSA